jgi:hypothetical protein
LAERCVSFRSGEKGSNVPSGCIPVEHKLGAGLKGLRAW